MGRPASYYDLSKSRLPPGYTAITSPPTGEDDPPPKRKCKKCGSPFLIPLRSTRWTERDQTLYCSNPKCSNHPPQATTMHFPLLVLVCSAALIAIVVFGAIEIAHVVRWLVIRE